MDSKQQEMTAMEAAGYILGTGIGLVWRYRTFFVILFACAMLPLVRIRISYPLPTDDIEWARGLVEGVILGVALLAGGLALWFSCRKQTR
jgi:hypothetical protein